MRAILFSTALLALIACSTDRRLLAPDHEAAKIVSPEKRHAPEDRGTDPVCGGHLKDAEYVWHASHEGEVFRFDSEECLRQFEANPDLFTTTVR